ncbi:Inorganic polyphosphate/ATP-NAD kinase [Actinomyces succiniciruminis]|uniref:NAD kinase n=2 Tax=Actinomycetaceae TaxID=2049 RepID=A0A1L7RM52_9ACTO|nr:Inorganic polyphosphate/ATP-NAD kinase [Actinomyces succiniciruminis]
MTTGIIPETAPQATTETPTEPSQAAYTEAATSPVGDAAPQAVAAANPTPQSQPRLRRVMVLQRDLNDKPVPPHRKAAPTATAVARAEAALRSHGVEPVEPGFEGDVDLVLVMGGDGTILRASEVARDRDVPLLGINTGHVGFLAEADPDAVEQVVADLVAGRYVVDTRMTIDVEVQAPDGSVTRDWALNEAALEKRDRARMVEVAVGVDGQAVSSFGCDGLVMATPTGSTAYAYSGGGPVIWPEVEALLLVPLSAHALFTRPLVVGPDSRLEVVIYHAGFGGAEVWCDGRRCLDAPTGSRICVTRAQRPVRLARLNTAPFATRLVRKFDLPVEGWRSADASAALPGRDGDAR